MVWLKADCETPSRAAARVKLRASATARKAIRSFRFSSAGCGWVQRKGGPVETIRPGDVVWFEPGEKHWHGATAITAMSHIAVQEKLDGSNVDWLEHVADADYQPIRD